MNSEKSVMQGSVSAESKMKAVGKRFRVAGIGNGLFSGLTYGIYSTLVMVASGYDPLVSAAGFLAAPFVASGLNDLFAGIWLLFYNAKQGRLKELMRTLKTKPGQMLVVGFLLGGPIANGAYLVGLAMAGAYAIPISATCSLFGSLFAWIFLKQKPTKRVVFGMMLCVMGAIIINWVKPEGAPNFTLGIICALIAAVCWGLEGVFSSFGGAMIDTDVAVNLRELISGLVVLILIVPLVGGIKLLGGTLTAGIPILWLALAGLSAAASFVCWYKANSMVGCAIGMSLNVTYAFWGVLFCVLFLGQTFTATIVIGSIVIVLGAIIVTMNPLDLIRKGDA
ncbi:DMT family transporter [Enterococcus hulanensis]|uniref:DMT family transporter n=1 Tax=Enterococcus hulanensis TaxID=2559929 RepID=A0ABU3EXH2_9ENTE|nr:DMT family transporter [Enterococcus hulanensis]MDT2599575.1 DMT family transporter [Enterococcus hulanensis]MDT2609569.1 DMT family transporter [Enterococcus hulanensis]MDT2616146.1 DMT family transporter [Enterococcus hulanensis]MDT2627814.1 DMT family transporter [Enterococcus hulanensis]MDT2654919.1 DMT family transporter [Enterococcus hulanensis]